MPDAWSTCRRDARLLGAAFRARRKASEDSLTDASVLTGLSKPVLSEIENGRRIPDPDQALALERIYPQQVLERHTGGGAPVSGASLRNVSPKARTGDPASSHHTVASIENDEALAGWIIGYATRNREPWDDTDLWNLCGRRWQRNVIARARGGIERQGIIVRVGQRPRRGRDHPTVHFVHIRYQ